MSKSYVDVARVELWTLVLCAAFGADGQVPVHLPSLGDIHQQLPCPQELWTESSKDGWLTATAKTAKSLHSTTFASSLAILIQGGTPTEEISPFGTLVLISGLLIYILILERTTSLDSTNNRSHWVTSAEKSLKAWEKTWKNHSQGPAHSTRGKNEHLLADCVPLFLTACYHTYASRLLKHLKASLGLKMLSEAPPDAAPIGNSVRGYILPTVKGAISWKTWEELLTPQSEIEWNDLTQPVRFAAGYILVRAKQGFRNVARTAPLEMGFHNVLSGFEGGESFFRLTKV